MDNLEYYVGRFGASSYVEGGGGARRYDEGSGGGGGSGRRGDCNATS